MASGCPLCGKNSAVVHLVQTVLCIAACGSYFFIFHLPIPAGTIEIVMSVHAVTPVALRHLAGNLLSPLSLLCRLLCTVCMIHYGYFLAEQRFGQARPPDTTVFCVLLARP